MNHKINRREFVAGATASALAVGIGASCKDEQPAATTTGTNVAAAKKPFEGEELRIFIYSGAWEKVFREVFVPSFKELTGAEVVLDPGWWDSIPKLKASPPGQPAFDLVLTDATQGYPAIREGMFQKLDLAKIPNHKLHSPAALDNWVFHDSFGLPYPDSVMTLAYRNDAVKEPPKGWEALLEEPHTGHLGMYNSFYMSLHTFAAMKVAADGRPGTAHQELLNNLDDVMKFAVEQRDRVATWWPTSTDMVFALRQKNAHIGNMHSTDMLPALRESKELGAAVPEHDRAYVQLMWVIPSDTKKVELAHTAIDFISGEKMQRALAELGSATPMLSVAQEVAKKDPIWGGIYPATEEQMKSITYYPYDAYFKDWDGVVEAWDKTVLRKKG